MSITMPEIVRRAARRVLRCIAGHGPAALKRAVLRLPFSRFEYILDVFFRGEETIEWRGTVVKVNPGELHGYLTYAFGAYANEEIEKLIGLCRTAHVFVDVGAAAGLMSLAVAGACPHLTVYAFEPDKESIVRFRDNIGLNREIGARIHLIGKAAAGTNGTLFFQPSADPRNPETGRVAGGETPHAIDAVRLDSFFETVEPLPDVVKVDVEGAEQGVLDGMKGLFDKGYPKAIMVEVHAYQAKEQQLFNSNIKNTLEKAGFLLYQLKQTAWSEPDEPHRWPGRSQILGIRMAGTR